MNTIHIDRLILRCRGIEPDAAQAALRELGPALLRQLREGGREGADHDWPRSSDTVRVAGTAAATAVADAVAARVAATVHGKTAPTKKPGRF
jgi:hypothetical protein